MSRAYRRGGYITCEAEVEINVHEVLEQISDKDLIDEMDTRKIERQEQWQDRNVATIEELERITDCLRRGWNKEALVRCERMLDAVTKANVPLARIPELRARYAPLKDT